MSNYLSSLLDLIFPPKQICPLCGAFSEKAEVCPECREILAGFSKEPVCARCGRFFSGTTRNFNDFLCIDCSQMEWPFQMHRAVGPYEGLLKDAIHRLKFNRRRILARPLARLMAGVFDLQPAYRKAGLLVPVPLSPGRLAERGFNQAELLAGELSALVGIPMVPVLKKIRETEPQTGLTRSRREANLKGAFDLYNPNALRAKTVILLDDVFTTGSTMSEAAVVLHQGGALSVLGLSLAAGRTCTNI